MGIIVISSRVLLPPLVELLLLKPPLGPDENVVMPLFGTNVDTVYLNQEALKKNNVLHREGI